MSPEQWFWGVVTVVVLAAIGWVAIEAVNAPTLEEPTPLDELMDGPAAKAAAQFTRAGWIEEPPGSGYWVKDESGDTTPEQRRAARQAYDRRALLADDECPLEDIPGLDLTLVGPVLATIADLPTTNEGAQ